jgi:DNA (cytosine-5)-methyltransferase 1
MRDAFDSGKRPPIVAIENVTGLLYGDNFAGLCEALAALDMKFGAMVLDARWFVPQSRPRVFVVAVDAKVSCERLTQRRPMGLHLPKALVSAHGRLSNAVKDRWLWWRFQPPAERAIPPVETFIDVEPSGVRWNQVAETNRLLGMMSEVNRAKVCDAAQSGEFRVGFLYKRMREGRQRAEVRFDGVAGCLRTPGGGSSRQTILVVRGKQIRSRLLSTREAARLMGLGDDFLLPGTYNEAYRAMGDGVASSVVNALSEQILMPLAHAAAACRSSANRGVHSAQDPTEFRARAESRAAGWAGAPAIK